MGMGCFAGKTVCYTSQDDAIHPDTKVTYTDQNGNERELDIKELLKLAKQSKNQKFFGQLVSDIEGEGLHIGFPIIVALNHLAIEFGGKKVMKVLK